MKVFSPFLKGNTTTSGSLNIPQHPTSSAIINPITGSLYNDTTDNVLKVYTGTQWQAVGEQATPVNGPAQADIEYLLVAGGGGAAGRHSGGGGAGGYLSSSLSLVTSGSTFTLTIGAGGSGAGDPGGGPTDSFAISGVDSSIAGATISTITTLGGGRGVPYNDASSGGSGGGGGWNNSSGGAGGSGTVGQGNDGGAGVPGNGSTAAPQYGGGGGGGASQAGVAGTSTYGGNGGDGLTSSITGTATTRGGGGGGSTYSSGTNGSGGTGGGGAGSNSTGISGTANTGGGGGGAGPSSTGGSGGSGVAILAYPTASISATGGVRTFFNDRVAHTFNSSGTFNVGGVKTYTHNTLDVFGDSSCLALYKFDGNANDESGTYNGTASNVTYTQSYINDGGVFNGSSSRIQTPQHLTGNPTFSVSMWVYPTATGVFYANGAVTAGPVNNTLHIFYDGGNSQFRIGRYGLDFITHTGITGSLWYHIVVTGNGSTVNSYVNNGTVVSSNQTLSIGAGETNFGKLNGHEDYYFGGKLDQFRLFNKVLSASEVATLYAE